VSLLHLGEVLLAADDLPAARDAAIRAAAIVDLDRDEPTPSRDRCLELLAALARRGGRAGDAEQLARRAAQLRARRR
jgi:hypothetical protein